MKVVSLLENTTKFDNMQIEHGLSLYIETENYKILFDTGQSDLFARNAEKLGIDLTAVDFVVLSHGHYDHGGGLETFFKINHTAKVYISKYAFEPHFNGKNKYIGLDMGLFRDYKDCFIFTEDENIISDGISIFNCNNNRIIYELNPYGLKRGIPKNDDEFIYETNGISIIPEDTELKFVPDDFHHEQYLLIEEKDRHTGSNKAVLFSGCSHKGILNIMSWCNPDILIGGFHFKSLDMEGCGAEKSRQVLSEAASVLSKYKCKYYTCHCTGVPQYEYLKSLMGQQLDYFSTGMTLDL